MWLKRAVRILLFFLFFTSMNVLVGNSDDTQYAHILTLESPNPEDHAWYGQQVEIDGDIIAVIEPYGDINDFENAGIVYLYDTDWNLILTLQSPTPGSLYGFGGLDMHDDAIVIQEFRAPVDDIEEAGKVHMFNKDGTWLLSIPNPKREYNCYLDES